MFTATEDRDGPGAPHFEFAKADRRVIAYYFYVVHEAFGPAPLVVRQAFRTLERHVVDHIQEALLAS